MPLDFGPIRVEQQTEYLKRLSFCPGITSDYSFINLWAWAEEYGLWGGSLSVTGLTARTIEPTKGPSVGGEPHR